MSALDFLSIADEELEAFRSEVRRFIADTLPPDMAKRTLVGTHPNKDDVLFWTRKLQSRGWSVPNWPVEFGGPGWTVAQRHVFDEECFLAGCPELSAPGIHLVGPIIYTFGNAAQQQRFLPGIRSADEMWAQGFSEPNAGSDLAALRTQAIRDGDDYIVNGQKIWTSEAQISEWIFLLVRTSNEGKPQAGISFLLVDAKSPGITIRPILTLDRGHSLNEVFFEDVRVPAENRVGEENKGWGYAKELLSAERTFSAEVPRIKGLLSRVRQMAAVVRDRDKFLIERDDFIRRLAELEIELLAHEATLWRVVSEEEAGSASAGLTASVLKVRGTELVQRAGALLVEAIGESAVAFVPHGTDPTAATEAIPGGPLSPGVTGDFLYRRSATIYGGTNEVQRNIIARQLLGR